MKDDEVDGGRPDQFREYFYILRRSWWVVVVGGLCVGILALGVSLLQAPVYRACSTLYVTSGTDANSQTAYQGSLASQQRVASYAKLVTSDAVVSSALSDGGFGLSNDDAKKALSSSTSSDTVLLGVCADDESGATAMNLANAVSLSMTRYVTELEKPSLGGQPLAKLTIVTPATIPDSPISPSVVRNTGLGIVVGIGLGLLYLGLRHRLDTRIRVKSDVTSLVSSPVLTSVPHDVALSDASTIDFGVGSSPAAEAYRRLRSNLAFVSVDRAARVILVTSANPNEGKTTTAVNLASALAESGVRVVVVDADLRKPSVGERLPVNADVGFASFLRRDASIRDLVQPAGISSLDVLASGQLPPNPTELLGSNRAQEGLRDLSSIYDYVIIDSPPLLPVTDATVVAQYADGVLLVARAGETRRSDLSAAVDQLRVANCRILGVLLNDVEAGLARYQYSYYGSEPGGPVAASADGVFGDRDSKFGEVE